MAWEFGGFDFAVRPGSESGAWAFPPADAAPATMNVVPGDTLDFEFGWYVINGWPGGIPQEWIEAQYTEDDGVIWWDWFYDKFADPGYLHGGTGLSVAPDYAYANNVAISSAWANKTIRVRMHVEYLGNDYYSAEADEIDIVVGAVTSQVSHADAAAGIRSAIAGAPGRSMMATAPIRAASAGAPVRGVEAEAGVRSVVAGTSPRAVEAGAGVRTTSGGVASRNVEATVPARSATATAPARSAEATVSSKTPGAVTVSRSN
jgi:hypothetical protein